MELLPADVTDAASIAKACEGCAAAYYLVHSMMPGEGKFEEVDRDAARNMARAAGEAGLSRLIYLGGLGEENPSLSRHLRSRAEVAEITLLPMRDGEELLRTTSREGLEAQATVLRNRSGPDGEQLSFQIHHRP